MKKFSKNGRGRHCANGGVRAVRANLELRPLSTALREDRPSGFPLSDRVFQPRKVFPIKIQRSIHKTGQDSRQTSQRAPMTVPNA